MYGIFSDEMIVTQNKDLFLSNIKNKANFISMLGKYLLHNGCKVIHADGDADLLIIKQTRQSALCQTLS